MLRRQHNKVSETGGFSEGKPLAEDWVLKVMGLDWQSLQPTHFLPHIFIGNLRPSEDMGKGAPATGQS